MVAATAAATGAAAIMEAAVITEGATVAAMSAATVVGTTVTEAATAAEATAATTAGTALGGLDLGLATTAWASAGIRATTIPTTTTITRRRSWTTRPTYYVTPPATTYVVPDTSDYYTSAPVDDSAHVNVMVPSPDAQGPLQRQPDAADGDGSRVRLPVPDAGSDVSLHHRSALERERTAWSMQTRSVPVTAGQTATVDFTH